MKPLRALRLLASALLCCGGCSGGQGQQPSGSADASSADVADADPPCPDSLPSGACPAAGQTCFYGQVSYDPNEHQNRCDCVAPEMQWKCCNINTVFTCAGGPSAFPVGSLCCPQDVNLSPETIGCTYCGPDDREVDLVCSSGDRHWRQSTTSCVYTPPTCPDGGLADLDASGGPCNGDDSGSDASLDAGVADGPSEGGDL